MLLPWSSTVRVEEEGHPELAEDPPCARAGSSDRKGIESFLSADYADLYVPVAEQVET
jgi:hypothetical protein